MRAADEGCGYQNRAKLDLTRLQQRLEAHGGRYFAADRLTVSDLKVFVWVRHLRSGVLDHIPADLPDRVAPKLVGHYERVKTDPRFQAFYDKHGVAGTVPDDARTTAKSLIGLVAEERIRRNHPFLKFEV